MSSKWFDIDEELSSNQDSFEALKKNFGLSTRKTESERKLKSWSSVNKVSDIFDLDTTRTGIFKDKLWDSVIKDRLIGKSKCREHLHISDTECDELLTDLSASAKKIRNRFSRDFDADLCERRMRKMHVKDSPSCSSTFSYPDGSGDHTWSRKSSCQGNVTFPESSTASVHSDATSEKSFGRSISVNSEESVCTEKSADCSTVCETLPDGTNKTQFENNETWLKKSNSGSVCEKKVKDSTITEKKEDRVCDKTTKKTSYIERSATGSSLQEESTSERVVSCDKTGSKTVEQKTSSETYKKAYRSPKSSSSFYDELDSCAFHHRLPTFRKSVDETGKTVSEKISKLIDEAVHQDNLFRIPSNLETDIDRMTNDFSEKGTFGREKRRHNRRRLSGLFSEAGNADHDINWSKLNELRTENESLIQENSKLQSIIQDVTAVNKRWQKYNNERRLYVQKLLSTIQDLQEQINLISEKSAFQSARQEGQTLLYDDIEKLKQEFQEHITVLELQIKSHKDDWEAERKEKQKIAHEKEELELKVQELLRELKFLKNILAEEKRKISFCGSCKTNVDDAAIFPGNEFFPANASLRPSNAYLSKKFRTAVHVPYNRVDMNDLSSDECFFSENYLSKEGMNDQRTSYFSTAGEAFDSERYSECSKKTSGDTIVVEDENGLRLSITEQFPSKDNLQLKSILKKTDKKFKMLSKTVSEQTELKKTGRSRKSSADERKLSCEECESQSISIGVDKEGLTKITSFSPYAIPDSEEYIYPNTEFLRVGTDIRSKSEPNTRSNSSENLKPLRESSSWNNQCTSAGGEVCSSCEPSYMPVPPEFDNRFESEVNRNQF